jgi:hypothetical protein
MNTCGALKNDGEACTSQAVTIARKFLPLCKYHQARLLADFRRERNASYQKGVNFHIDGRVEQHRTEQATRDSATVYFIRAGHRIKIGVSQDPQRRLSAIRTGGSAARPLGLDTRNARLIATEPGGPQRERELHRQFAHVRETGEWFRSCPELTSYINSLPERVAA